MIAFLAGAALVGTLVVANLIERLRIKSQVTEPTGIEWAPYYAPIEEWEGYDVPFGQIESLYRLPADQRRRLLEGDWLADGHLPTPDAPPSPWDRAQFITDVMAQFNASIKVDEETEEDYWLGPYRIGGGSNIFASRNGHWSSWRVGCVWYLADKREAGEDPATVYRYGDFNDPRQNWLEMMLDCQAADAS